MGVPTLTQILPGWIHRDDQGDLLQPCPTLHLLLARNRVVDVLERFVKGQNVHPVPAGETFELSGFVLPNTMSKVACHSNVKSARTVRHDVSVAEFSRTHNA